MKHLIARTLTSLMLVVGGLGITATAQSTNTIKVNIPFEFTVANHSFPAGDYTLSQPMQHYLVLRDSRARYVAQAFTGRIYSRTPAAETNLVFDSSNGQHILTEIWQQQDSSGERLYQPKPKMDLVKRGSTEAGGSNAGGQL